MVNCYRQMLQGLFTHRIAPDLVNDTLRHLSGGGAKSEVWRQMAADIFGLPVVTISGSGEGGAYGAALVAGVGLGLWKDLVEAAGNPVEETRNLPDPNTQAIYEKVYRLYDALYPSLKPCFDQAEGLR